MLEGSSVGAKPPGISAPDPPAKRPPIAGGLFARRLPAAGYQMPRTFHHRPPIPSQITMLTTLMMKPLFHQSPIST